MSLGEVLRNLLDERDISQKELADSLGIGSSTLGNYIQNSRAPDYDVLKNLARFFDVSIDYLLEHELNQDESLNVGEVVRIYRSLSADHQELFLAHGKVLLAHNRKNESPQS
ncbi:MAG: helix-turn-helix domain-containing protein [Oscillospiraceae bacterium]|nr:helix-turn-helix domain-containing protein [Oscillospiraceae bacterium]